MWLGLMITCAFLEIGIYTNISLNCALIKAVWLVSGKVCQTSKIPCYFSRCMLDRSVTEPESEPFEWINPRQQSTHEGHNPSGPADVVKGNTLIDLSLKDDVSIGQTSFNGMF